MVKFALIASFNSLYKRMRPEPTLLSVTPRINKKSIAAYNMFLFVHVIKSCLFFLPDFFMPKSNKIMFFFSQDFLIGTKLFLLV